MATRQMEWTRCRFQDRDVAGWVDEMDEMDKMDKMADVKCSRLKMPVGCQRMPAGGMDGIDKMRDAR